MNHTAVAITQLALGAALVAGGAVLWALTGASEAASAMIGAGATLMPMGAVKRAGGA